MLARSFLFCLSTVVLALTGCRAGRHAAAAGAARPPVVRQAVRAADFGDPARGANPYLPLVPGTQWVREGFTDVGRRRVPHQVTTTVSNVYRVVDGIRTVAMFDYELDGGQVTQTSIDYVAEDRYGNLWDFGGYTEEYQGGRYVSATDPWLAGVNGARAGILVQAHPRQSSPPYAVAQPDSEAGDVGEIVAVGTHRCVPFRCFRDVLIVREGKRSAPDNEFKYYARSVGQIDNVPRGDSVHQDVERLVNMIRLTPRGLAELSADVLRMDHHAARTSPEIFGKVRPGRIG